MNNRFNKITSSFGGVTKRILIVLQFPLPLSLFIAMFDQSFTSYDYNKSRSVVYVEQIMMWLGAILLTWIVFWLIVAIVNWIKEGANKES
jgi:hypothetical protein